MSPYKQAFIVTMETGAAALAVVMGEDGPHGEGLAHSAAQTALDGQIWDYCAFPVVDGLALGVTILKQPEG